MILFFALVINMENSVHQQTHIHTNVSLYNYNNFIKAHQKHKSECINCVVNEKWL